MDKSILNGSQWIYLLFIFITLTFVIFIKQYQNSRDISIYFASHLIDFEKNKLHSKHYLNQVAAYQLENEHIEKEPIIYIGDSHIRKFDLELIGLEEPVFNHGINGDTTLGVLGRLEKNVNNAQPGKVFLMVGYNDIKYRKTEDILFNYRKIIENISAVDIFIFSLLPVEKDRSLVNKKIIFLNGEIKKLSLQYGVRFIDLYSSFLNQETGGIQDKFTSDGTHLTQAGYLLWVNLLKNYFQRKENDIKEN